VEQDIKTISLSIYTELKHQYTSSAHFPSQRYNASINHREVLPVYTQQTYLESISILLFPAGGIRHQAKTQMFC
jgi:hypothetical protein